MHQRFEITEQQSSANYIVNPKIHLLLTFIFIIYIVTSERIELPKFFLYLLYLVIFAICCNSSLRVFLSSLLYILPFIIFLIIMFAPYLFKINCFDGWGFIKLCLDKNVVIRLVLVAMKMSLAMMAITIYVKAFSKSSILESLKWIGMPDILISMINITLLYTEMLKREVKKMVIAMRLRIFGGVSYITQWKMIAFKIGTLFLRSYKKITTLIYSLKLRGFTGTLATYESAPLIFSDLLFFIVMSGIITFIKLLSITYF